jgi:hypothetical protein
MIPDAVALLSGNQLVIVEITTLYTVPIPKPFKPPKQTNKTKIFPCILEDRKNPMKTRIPERITVTLGDSSLVIIPPKLPLKQKEHIMMVKFTPNRALFQPNASASGAFNIDHA